MSFVTSQKYNNCDNYRTLIKYTQVLNTKIKSVQRKK